VVLVTTSWFTFKLNYLFTSSGLVVVVRTVDRVGNMLGCTVDTVERVGDMFSCAVNTVTE
jgi:hypothetical protein